MTYNRIEGHDFKTLHFHGDWQAYLNPA